MVQPVKKYDRSWRKSRIAARLLCRKARGRLSPRDQAFARRLGADPEIENRLIQQALYYLGGRRKHFVDLKMGGRAKLIGKLPPDNFCESFSLFSQKDRAFQIVVYGSASLQLTVDQTLLSGDLDIFSDNEEDGKLDRLAPVAHGVTCPRGN